MPVRGRYAPSPTGPLHLGNARTALLSWLDIRSLGGDFVLRVEDLDPQRSSEASARQLEDDLRWLGLDWDEGPWRQGERRHLYDEAIERLLARKLAYPCSCTRAEVARAAGAPHAGEDGPRYPGTCRDGALHPERPMSVRLKVPPGVISFDDLVLGRVDEDVSQTVGDFALRRTDGVAAYQLAVALDDSLMQMDRVVRGDDLLRSTSRQLLVLRALALPEPRYGHVPLVVDETGHRLSKRGGALSLEALRARGVSPEAVVGFLAATWGQGDGRPVKLSELVADFRLADISKTAPVVTEASLATLLG